MKGDLLNAISNASNSDQQKYEEIMNKFVEIGESYPVTADEITTAIKREERENEQGSVDGSLIYEWQRKLDGMTFLESEIERYSYKTLKELIE